MNFTIPLSIEDIIIALLVFIIIGAFLKIRALKRTLAIEKRKRTMPLITMEVNTDNDFGVFLVNDSYCYAKNINAGDLDVVVDYGFKKHLTLKFEPLEILKPNGKVKLSYRVFDDTYDVTSYDDKKILNHFSDAPIEMHLRYENMEGSPFATIIESEKDQYITREVTALEEESR